LVQRAGPGRSHTTIAPAGDADLAAALDGSPGTPRPAAPLPQRGDRSLKLLRRAGSVDPGSLADYRAHGGYRALARAMAMGPEAVVGEVTAAQLVGRGGAAFPTGRKWAAVAAAPARPHHVV